MATVRQTIPADAPSPSPVPVDRSGSAVSLPNAASDAAPLPAAGELIEQRFEALLRQVLANRANEDVDLIRKAWHFCVQHHAGQLRASGEPYIIHPLEVAEVL